MQTTHSTSQPDSLFTSRILFALRSLFGGRNSGSTSLALKCANDIRRVSGLAQWIGSIAKLRQQDRKQMLLRAAVTFSGEFSASDLASTLSCMATDEGLFAEVNDALNKVAHSAEIFSQAA